MANTSRRDFIRHAGTYGAAAGVGLAGGIGLASPELAAAQATHPFGYPEEGLDIEKTRQLAYDGFKGITLADGTRHSGCAFGAFHALIGQLAEVVGAPYTAIPTQMMDWAGAGVVGFGTICGTLNGAAAAIGLICNGRDARAFISDLPEHGGQQPLPRLPDPLVPHLGVRQRLAGEGRALLPGGRRRGRQGRRNAELRCTGSSGTVRKDGLS
jgi:hypothetical protein